LKAKDIVVSFLNENIRKPQVVLSKKYPGEIAAHVPFIPRSCGEPEERSKLKLKHV
jgi:hypothetical protein